ncbi:hypothetical protein [Eisenbergiella porci]|uniref:hypothetical protein n=1 Tax=Eisenbergiella porci TaxID=2652274 RepID=UPI002A82D4A2|nr:hypothetical protein [Eisenbergiella porci]
MVILMEIEEIDGKPCLLVDSDIIEKTKLKPGDVVRVMVNEDMILIASDDLCCE